MILIGIEQGAIGPGQRIGLQCLTELRHLDEGHQPSQRTLGDGGCAKALQRRPDGLFDLRRHRDAFLR